MSIVDRRGVEIDLPHLGPDLFLLRWAEESPSQYRHWRMQWVAVLVLHDAGWSPQAITRLFGYRWERSVNRILRAIERVIAEHNTPCSN